MIIVTSPTCLKPLCLVFVMTGVLFLGLFKLLVLVATDVRVELHEEHIFEKVKPQQVFGRQV